MARAEIRPILRTGAALWVALAAIMGLWAAATPISAAPDEPAHLVKAAAVAHTQLTGDLTSDGMKVQVPAYVAWTHAMTCFAFNPDVGASCATTVEGAPGAMVESRTTAGLYNPLYYALVGWPTLVFDTTGGIYAMRVASAVLTAAFAAAALALALRWRRPVWGAAAVVGSLTPMVLFLGGVVNPNALETTTTLAAVVASMSIVRQRDRIPVSLSATVFAVAVAIGANTRGLAPLWFFVVVIVSLLLCSRAELGAVLSLRAVRVSAAVSAVAVAVAVAWTLSASSLTAAVDNPDAVNLYPGAGSPAIIGFAFVLERTFAFGGDMIGMFGWADTPAPAAVMAVWTLIILGLIVGAAAAAHGRRLLALLASIGSLILLPALLQGFYVTGGGFIWQGRYALPLLAVVLVTAALVISEENPRTPSFVSRRILIGGAAAMYLAQVYAFAHVLRRYATDGEASTWIDLLVEPTWQPPGTVLPLLAAYAVTTGLSAVAGVLWLRRRAHEGHEMHDHPDERTGRQSHGDSQHQITR
ncbi:DUF2142 domain-containing protein [Salinibacterium sp. ZJ77]|uniref:DUF2142 domain-containing protein n=1 Tax=Salinibacterium sp. ZJ77 TaxID=2708337 RepID=UPI0014232A86|nr:DUF2142 domain-containing protein [Salinibacterium sp. ZJ77]